MYFGRNNAGSYRNNDLLRSALVKYKERENRAYRLLADYCKYLEDCRIRYAPHTPEERPHPLFVTALSELEMFRYYRDIFIYGDYNERKAFIEEQGKLLEAISSILINKAA